MIDLSVIFAPLSKIAVTKGATLLVTNNGNVVDSSKFIATIGLQSNVGGAHSVAFGSGVPKPAYLNLKPGKTAKLRVSGWEALLATLASGNYYLTITLTEDTYHSGSAVSATGVS